MLADYSTGCLPFNIMIFVSFFFLVKRIAEPCTDLGFSLLNGTLVVLKMIEKLPEVGKHLNKI